jgi:ATP-dependent DNA ligase
VLNEERVMFYHNKWVAEGYEGCMVRDISAQYMFSFRDYCLLKVKNYIDEEFEILGCEADNHTEETIAESFVFVVKNNTDDQEFKARPTGTAKMKLFWYNNIDKYIGKKATVRFQERATSGLPIQGHVRAKETALLMEAIRDYE